METDSLDALLSFGTNTQRAGDQFTQMAELAKRVSYLQREINVLTRPQYVIEEMEP